MKKRIGIMIALFLTLWNTKTWMNVKAKEAEFDSGRIIVSGGRNEYDGIRNQSRQESKELAEKLSSENYVLISGSHKEISEEELRLLTDNDMSFFWFTAYLEMDEDNYQVYVYRDSLKDYINAVQTDTFVPFQPYGLDAELSYGAVMIDYSLWDSVEAVGTYSDEWGSRIQDNPYVGYLYVSTPVDVVITFESTTKKVYYEIPFSAENPQPVRMLYDTYIIRHINRLNVDSYEETLPFENYIRISETHSDADNPYILSLYEFADKYDLIEIEENTERQPIAEPWEIQKETTIVEQPEEKETPIPVWVWILTAIAGAGLSGMAIRFYQRNIERGNNNEK